MKEHCRTCGARIGEGSCYCPEPKDTPTCSLCGALPCDQVETLAGKHVIFDADVHAAKKMLDASRSLMRALIKIVDIGSDPASAQIANEALDAVGIRFVLEGDLLANLTATYHGNSNST